jgi:hypothetical protein
MFHDGSLSGIPGPSLVVPANDEDPANTAHGSEQHLGSRRKAGPEVPSTRQAQITPKAEGGCPMKAQAQEDAGDGREGSGTPLAPSEGAFFSLRENQGGGLRTGTA